MLIEMILKRQKTDDAEREKKFLEPNIAVMSSDDYGVQGEETA